MTNDIKGDSTSSSSHELMLWLQYEGGQLPIGWTNGPSATIDDLFGTSWTLYEDVNTDTGITVSTLMPAKQFEGSFSGDLKDWLLALVEVGTFKKSTYVNVGNAGYVLLPVGLAFTNIFGQYGVLLRKCRDERDSRVADQPGISWPDWQFGGFRDGNRWRPGAS